jgi:hypothetical protein
MLNGTAPTAGTFAYIGPDTLGPVIVAPMLLRARPLTFDPFRTGRR